MRIIITFLACIVSFTIHSQVSSEGYPMQWGNTEFHPANDLKTTPVLDLEVIAKEDSLSRASNNDKWRFGIEHEVQYSLDNSGVWTEENGMHVWRLGINCPNAKNISFFMSKYNLPKGAKLFVWNASRTEFLGSFTDRNNKDFGSLAIGLISGSSVVLEYQVQLSNLELGELEIGKVIHGYKSLLDQDLEIQERSGPFGTTNLTCHKDVNCPLGIDWQVEKKSVALIVCGGACCTGALINNTSENGAPYLLTANHCVNEYDGTFNDPLLWVFYFNHETTSCDAATYTTNQSISAGILAAWSSTTDFALIELTDNPQTYYDVIYAGWDNSEHTAWHVTSIHHPAGESKMISAFYDPLDPSWSYQVNSFGVESWFVPHWSAGTVEPGSSGAPLFDDSNRIIGQLWGGGGGYNCDINDWDASNVNFYSWYGRFDLSWNLGLSTYLDPGNTGTQTLDAYDPNAGNDGGCIDDTYCNYDPDALYDDGSCTVDDICGICGGDGSTCSGCTDSMACNYDSNAIVDDGSCSDSGIELIFNILTDGYPSETTWYISDDNGNIVMSGGPYDLPNGEFSHSTVVPQGCYTLNVEDSYGDGICCAYGEGEYSLMSQGQTLAIGGEFSNLDSTTFCVACESTVCTGDVNGDGSVTVADILIIISEFGCDTSCSSDIDLDGTVTISDILIMLSEFGSSC